MSTLEELRDRIRRHAAAATNELEDDLLEVLTTITRLEGEAIAYQNTIDGLEFLNNRLDSLEPDQLEGLTAKWPMIMATVAKGEVRAEAAEATLAEATSATMMAEMRADKLMAENARLREAVTHYACGCAGLDECEFNSDSDDKNTRAEAKSA